MKQINVLELFAGVGGFRVGLEKANDQLYITKWSNQWEPSRKSQDAFEVYQYHFPESENINEDISTISDERFAAMDADMIVGGFPCQDYSVARSKKNEKGIEGKKGVLFWEIIRATEAIRPKYLILENVDRLLKAPSKQRGRDFAIMLAAFNNLGYSVEWRVINAADYSGAQRRRRVFFFVFRNDLPYALNLDEKYENNPDIIFDENRYNDYIFNEGLFAKEFPVLPMPNKERKVYYELAEDIVEVSEDFSGTVWNTGIMRHGKFYSIDTIPYDKERPIPLKDIIQAEEEVAAKYFITDKEKLEKFQYLRGAKKILRTSGDGHQYYYSEGGMSPTDDLNLPGRTMLTSEGSVNRSTHFIEQNGKYRLLTPVEAERLQHFPDNWTAKKLVNGKVEEVSDKMRMFFMGNALVTMVVEKIGKGIEKIEKEYQ